MPPPTLTTLEARLDAATPAERQRFYGGIAVLVSALKRYEARKDAEAAHAEAAAESAKAA